MRATRNKAKALESRVDSPGKVDWNPLSETFSSSISNGYSASMSFSFISFGSPSKAAEKLQRFSIPRFHSGKVLHTSPAYTLPKRLSSSSHLSMTPRKSAFGFDEDQADGIG